MPKQKDLFQGKIYCIDSSALINLKPYRRDIFPTIWNKLENMIKKEELIAPSEVYGEIEVVQNSIYEWCKSNKKMFNDVDGCQADKLQEIKSRYDKGYWNNENNKPKWADPWVIALAICEEATIVADEKNAPNKIPAIAAAFGVTCLGLLDFFKEIGIQY